MAADEAIRRQREEREDRDRGIRVDPHRYSRLRGHLYSQSEIRTICSYLRPRRPDTVADLGCGVGRITLDLAPRVRTVKAYDFSSESLNILEIERAARGLDNVTARRVDIRELPLATGSCDAAVSCQVIQHIPSDEWRQDAVRDACGREDVSFSRSISGAP